MSQSRLPLALILALALAGAAAPALAAGKASPADRKAVAACLERAEREQRSGLACVGILADPCLSAPGAKAPLEACATRELVVWSERLERATARFQASMSPDHRAAHVKAQAQWLAYRDTFCPIRDRLDPYFALAGAAYCVMRETAARAVAMEELAAAVEPH